MRLARGSINDARRRKMHVTYGIPNVDICRRQRNRYTNRHYEAAEIINHPFQIP